MHLRRKDYRIYSNGDLYFDDSIIINWIKKLYNIDNKIIFIIFSDEEINCDFYKDLPIIFSHGNSGGDLYLMSKCDYIFGPLSTYSWIAHFLGNNYICYLNKNSDISFDSFKKNIIGVV